MPVHSSEHPLRIVVLVSGNGSNLQAIIDSSSQQNLAVRVVAVFSNNPDAYGLERARHAHIPALVVNHRDYVSREDYDRVLMQEIDAYQPDLVVLAGFMRILSDEFVIHYLGRMINIHPSLLPKYKGLKTHQRVLEAGDTQHGCTVHYVTPALDDGPVILQRGFQVRKEDTVDTLAQRVHKQEHIIYPKAIQWIAEGLIHFADGDIVSSITDSDRFEISTAD